MGSVRDLLRAIRNKKHHYRELTEDAKALYGAMPGEFSDYWTSRFPRLLMHSYKAMQCCKMEPNFEKYYYKDFDFVPVMPRQQGDIHPSDVDLLSPGFLDPPCPATQAPSPHSVVSTWSQLSQGSRLSADSSYRDDLLLPSQLSQGSRLSVDSNFRDELLLPCSRDPSSEEGSDAKDLSEEELESVEECQELRQNAIEPDNDCCEQKLEDKELQRIPKGVEEDEIEALIDVEADTLVTTPSEELEAGEGENFCDNGEKILNLNVAIKCVTANGNEVECQMPFGETT